MEFLDKILVSENYAFIALVLVAMLVVWFLPAILALVFNRKQFKYILLACIPAGISLIAWSGVMVWAVSGKAISKYSNKKATD